MEFRIHWMAITIWKPSKHAFALWDIWFAKYFGPVFPAGHRARMFEEVHKGLLGVKLYVMPLRVEDEHFHLEIPGKACEAIQPIELMQFIVDLSTYEKYKVTRLDLAWDGVPFTLQEFFQAIFADKARTYAKRETLHYSSEPFGLREDGEVGTSNTTLGKRQSKGRCGSMIFMVPCDWS